MNRLHMTKDLRRKVHSDHPKEIICVNARDVIWIVDTLNWAIAWFDSPQGLLSADLKFHHQVDGWRPFNRET